MILIIGSSGILGSDICRVLRQKEMPFRAMIRTGTGAAKIETLKSLGAETVLGDLKDKASLLKALKGISTVITTVSAMPFSYVPGSSDLKSVDDAGMENLVDACRQSGVKHLIYTSFSKNLDANFPLRDVKRKAEKAVMQSGLMYTILRPSFFMESWLSPMAGFDPFNGNATIYGSGKNPVSYVAIHDVACFAVECLFNPASANAVLELGGPQKISQLEAVEIFENVLRKEIRLTFVPFDSLQAQLAAAEDDFQKSFAGLMLGVASGDAIEMKEMAEKFGIRLTSIKEYAISQLKAATSR
jgi:uncharacterized protein YbjT (DUF2867 family)